MSKELQINALPAVQELIAGYPGKVQRRLQQLRKLILEVAAETAEISEIEETLKWNEPSYLVKGGSTLRFDWKPKAPDQYALYFKCTSKLVESFKNVYGSTFKYENNRAIVFNLDESIPEKELKSCIQSALTYHKVKHLKNLGLVAL